MHYALLIRAVVQGEEMPYLVCGLFDHPVEECVVVMRKAIILVFKSEGGEDGHPDVRAGEAEDELVAFTEDIAGHHQQDRRMQSRTMAINIQAVESLAGIHLSPGADVPVDRDRIFPYFYLQAENGGEGTGKRELHTRRCVVVPEDENFHSSM